MRFLNKNKSFIFYLFAFSTILTFVGCSNPKAKMVDGTLKPEESRFTIIELARGLDEPVKMQVLPNGNVIVIERRGAIKKYNHQSDTVEFVDSIAVFDGLEDGLLGFAIDPDYVHNNWVYFFYSPKGKDSVQRISRFDFAKERLNKNSEKVIIEIPLQRKECCHSAGSIQFGADRELYIAIGDNTNPHNDGYYNSIDERKGREYWDAQRTAANTNDLRGKILRIKVLKDGSYTIPMGNLFTEKDSLTRPEIYAMGVRNPFSMAVDSLDGWLLWGDVGQNTIDDPSRGPISYDEWNLTKDAGFFGWPYFAGPNSAYTHFDYETNTNGPFYEVEKPINKSKNNTGREILPEAKGALIWYSYDESKEFNHLGTGGKSPIAGPRFHFNNYDQSTKLTSPKFPEYFDGKWFIAEWMRDWINVVTVNENGEFVGIEPFLSNEQFNHPIDLKFGPDGALYVLEYGTNWFAKNSNSRLVKIVYEGGNRKPLVQAKADVYAGSTPLKVQFSSEGTIDHDTTDQLTYSWNFGDGKSHSSEKNPSFTFNNPGAYQVKLIVKDQEGKKDSAIIHLTAGNSIPTIDLKIQGNKSFYWNGRSMDYELLINDKEDGNLDNGITNKSISFYSKYGQVSGEINGQVPSGLALIEASDCKSCHALTDESVGPAYIKIANRYKNQENMSEILANRIISGASGSWGKYVMSAHPQLSSEEATEMTNYILSLAQVKMTGLNPKGRYVFNLHSSEDPDQRYVFNAEYNDRPIRGISTNKVNKHWVFRPLIWNMNYTDFHQGIEINSKFGRAKFLKNNSYAAFRNVDLTGLTQMEIVTDSIQTTGNLEIRSQSRTGPLIGQIKIEKGIVGEKKYSIPFNRSNKTEDLFVIFKTVNPQKIKNYNLIINSISFYNK